MRTFQFDPVAAAPRAENQLAPRIQPRHHHAVLSRRALLTRAAGAAGGVLAATALPRAALAARPTNSTPKPTFNIIEIGGLDFALTFFGPGMDPSSITDFNGFVGVAQVQGTGTGTNPDGSTETLLFDTDLRFMSGAYVAVDGAVHKGAFGFV